jgi:transcription-repair coupling factor (superfamily II helicase)
MRTPSKKKAPTAPAGASHDRVVRQKRAPQPQARDGLTSQSPIGALAVHLLTDWTKSAHGLVFIARDEPRAEQLAAILAALEPSCDPMVLPRWPYTARAQSAVPSHAAGRRASVLRRAGEHRKPLILTTPDATLRMVPPRDVFIARKIALARGDVCGIEELQARLAAAGYRSEPRVDGPCELSVQGSVLDVFPAGALGPTRVEFDDGRVARLSAFDPATQRVNSEVDALVADVVSEALWLEQADDAGGDTSRTQPVSIFAYLSEARFVADHAVSERAATYARLLQETSRADQLLAAAGAARSGATESYMSLAAWKSAIESRKTKVLPEGTSDDAAALPRFSRSEKAAADFAKFVQQQIKARRRVVLAAAAPRELTRLAKRLPRQSNLRRIARWSEVARMPRGTIATLRVGLPNGFALFDHDTVVVAAPDVLGSAAAHERTFAYQSDAPDSFDEELRPGDLVLHLDRGLARLTGLEQVAHDDAAAERLRLAFRDASSLVEVGELAKIWRYGGEDKKLALDTADGSSWTKRRKMIDVEIAATARELGAALRERAARRPPRLVAPAAAYERFVMRFPYFLTADQSRAIGDVETDLASGRAMDRLVCGDVGYGKTEIALRAAAIAALCGHQVAVVAPTTVLARQHYENFSQRFGDLGLDLALLSGSCSKAEASAIRAGLSAGRIAIVVGTHAIIAKAIRFKDLALVIVDEEQRFGVREKLRFRELGRQAHLLTLTATPIPRTLQACIVGLRDLSVVATPPTQRVPVRTIEAVFEDALVGGALQYEKRRGGQTIVVCPRIADIAPMTARLHAIAPDLSLEAVHGELPSARIDDVMLRFSAGSVDVLLTTAIVENGLDIPRANTILIYRADRFGLAQLHQLRGRVGRSEHQGFAYLLPEGSASRASDRLSVLTSESDLGAGFRISAHDLAVRGAGDLIGERQAGHIKLLGAELYRHLLDAALRRAADKAAPELRAPQLLIDVTGAVPATYVPQEETRLEIYWRLSKMTDEGQLDDLAEEMTERFGPIPLAMRNLLSLTSLRIACVRKRVDRITAGPRALALEFATRPKRVPAGAAFGGRLAWKAGRLLLQRPTTVRERISLLGRLLQAIEIA